MTRAPVRPRRAALATALVALASCSIVHERASEAPVEGRASGQSGLLLYSVGRLSFLAPDSWEARGSSRRVQLSHPQGQGRLDAQQVERTFADDRACLADADQSLAKGSANLTNVRRHPSTFAGRKAVAQEADQGGWHGWAWAVCDGTTQYRLFFAGRTPAPKDVVDAMRSLTRSAALGDGGDRS